MLVRRVLARHTAGAKCLRVPTLRVQMSIYLRGTGSRGPTEHVSPRQRVTDALSPRQWVWTPCVRGRARWREPEGGEFRMSSAD